RRRERRICSGSKILLESALVLLRRRSFGASRLSQGSETERGRLSLCSLSQFILSGRARRRERRICGGSKILLESALVLLRRRSFGASRLRIDFETERAQISLCSLIHFTLSGRGGRRKRRICGGLKILPESALVLLRR